MRILRDTLACPAFSLMIKVVMGDAESSASFNLARRTKKCAATNAPSISAKDRINLWSSPTGMTVLESESPETDIGDLAPTIFDQPFEASTGSGRSV